MLGALIEFGEGIRWSGEELPGQAPGDVPIGAKVRLTFEATPATGQKVPEWTVVKT